jgi:hypothetical protein
MADGKKTGYDVTFHIDKQGENIRVSWLDIHGDGPSFGDACDETVRKMHERFIAMAQVSDHLDDGGQAMLQKLCAVFAPEKLEETSID